MRLAGFPRLLAATWVFLSVAVSSVEASGRASSENLQWNPPIPRLLVGFAAQPQPFIDAPDAVQTSLKPSLLAQLEAQILHEVNIIRQEITFRAQPDHFNPIVLTASQLFAQLGTLMLFPPANWQDNSRSRGDQFTRSWSEPPVWGDGDPWTTNYVGHPVMGASIYLFARHNGYSAWGSFAFMTVASTMWEYVFEAAFEQPSGTDLLVTPLIGAPLGELLWYFTEELRASPPTSIAGKAAKMILDPVRELGF
jgi:hypothetical protein